MKFILFALLFSLNAFATSEICDYRDTWSFEEDHQAFKKVSTLKATSFKERQMIHAAVTLQEHLSGKSKEEAMEEFFGADGHIRYYKDGSTILAIVSYFPGDNEYGAIYLLSEKMGSSFRKVAIIGDSDILCE
jgi:hypothetical protein